MAGLGLVVAPYPAMILNGWKEIAKHLGRGVRTVQRWESLGLPIRRPRDKSRSAVCAFTEELDHWLKAVPSLGAEHAARSETEKPAHFRRRVLLVDDDEALLITTGEVLNREGYEVRTARDGFEALAVLRESVPDVIVSDLNMPNMSGFELLGVVRKRFPAVAVVAISGEFAPATVPLVLADRHVQKGSGLAGVLAAVIKELISQSPLRPQGAKLTVAPIWVPHSPTGYVVLTCSECLRPFSVPAAHLVLDRVGTEKCFHCAEEVSYRIDPTLTTDVVKPPSLIADARQRVQSAIELFREVSSAPPQKTRRQ